MRVFTISETISVLRGERDAEPKYRKVISERIIQQFGKGPYAPDVQLQVFSFCQEYYIEAFEKTCEQETSFNFYREVFVLHEQATDLRHSKHYFNLPAGIDQQYISIYRRVLKMILEKGCDFNMYKGEQRDEIFIRRIQPVLNNLFYIGEQLFGFTESYAEFSMIEGISQITFDENDLYKQEREPHLDYVFQNISKAMEPERESYIIDPTGSADYKAAIQEAFGFDYDKVGLLIAQLYDKFGFEPPDCLSAERLNFIRDAAIICGVSQEIITAFFAGLILDRNNKMPLATLVRKPYLMNRFLYRPFLEWRINDIAYLVCGIYSLDEAENSLILNAIPWGKFPAGWSAYPSIKTYVDRKHDQHDEWLDDQVEKIITACGLQYDRGVERILTKGGSISLIVKSLGQIDFLIICPATQKLLVTECKHLLGRYDMINWKLDHDHFTEDGSKPGYNTRLAAKVAWMDAHLPEVEEHFRIIYKDNTISLKDYQVEGVFVINTPTFYMFNAVFRIYTFDQFEAVITGRHTDPVYTLIHETDDSIATYWVKYPYFAKRALCYFEDEDDEGEVDQYGDTI